MNDHELELRLTTVAHALDARAPAFDPAVLRAEPRRRPVRATVALLAAVVGLAGLAAAPAAISGLGELFGVDRVPELGSVPYGVAPPLVWRQVPPDAVQAEAHFRVRTLPSLGAPEKAFVRDDINGGMASLVYDGGRVLLTQWPAGGVHARIAVVPVTGTADDVLVGRRRALWMEGTARGTFTLTGADGAVHRELFDVAKGALLWEDKGNAFLLQGAGPRADATKIAADVEP